MKIAKKAVCLCSGGMDSTTAATIAKRAGYELYLFHVNYGQKAEKKELEVISKLKEVLGATDLVSVDIDLFRNLSALTSPEAAIPSGDAVDLNAKATPPHLGPVPEPGIRIPGRCLCRIHRSGEDLCGLQRRGGSILP